MKEENKYSSTLCIFDIDGTLTPPRKVSAISSRKPIEQGMRALIAQLKEKVDVAVISGSDRAKQIEQFGEDFFNATKYCFTQHGLMTYEYGKLTHTKSVVERLGNQNLKRFVNFCLKYIADLDIPIKRGTFIELRTGLINVCPIGRNCSYQERLEFFEYDKTENIREDFVEALKKEFKELGLSYSIGGQISFDVFPEGWDKRFALQFVEDKYETIRFFGDRTDPGGNDHQIYEDPRTIGHKVNSPKETAEILKSLFFK